MGRTRVFSFVACVVLGSMVSADPAAPQPGDQGSSSPPATQPAPALATDPALDAIHDLYAAGRYEATHDAALAWLKQNPHAADRDRGVMLLAEAYFVLDRRIDCFYECDELLESFPDSRLFFPALELQYRVADEYLRGHKDKFLGLAIVPMEDIAIEMMYRVQEHSPGSPIAERALRRTADYYYHVSQFDLAADAYGAFLRIYPRSPESARARLREAYSNFAQFRGPRYDATPLLDARTEFQEVIALTPDLAQEEGVQQFIDRIDEQLAAKIASDADYYLGVHNLKGAAFVYRTLIQRYPNSIDADRARKILSKMPAEALTGPKPPASAGQIPTQSPASRPTFGP